MNLSELAKAEKMYSLPKKVNEIINNLKIKDETIDIGLLMNVLRPAEEVYLFLLREFILKIFEKDENWTF